MRTLLCFVALFALAAAHEAHSVGATGEDVGIASLTSILDPAIVRAEAQEITPWIISIRRRLHTHPEILYELHNTSAYVRQILDELSIPYDFPIAVTGIVAHVGTRQGPVVALRADMDGLPINEEISSSFKSLVPGRMHACGHDGHTAMLLGAARILKKYESQIKGTVKLVFQPAEEGGAGALQMIKEGVLENPKVQRMFGIHIWPYIPTNHVMSRPGPLMAAAGFFEATLTGASGHAAIPGAFVDPIVAMSSTISSIQTIVARQLATTESGVISITRVRAGDAYNIIPDKAVFGGTIRSFSRNGYHWLEKRIKEIANHTAEAYGTEFSYGAQVLSEDCLEATVPAHFPGKCVFPPLVNDGQMFDFGLKVAAEVVGGEKVGQINETMTGEDFAYFAERVPACFFFLGSGNAAKQTDKSLHSSQYSMDEDVLETGVTLHVMWALRSIDELLAQQQQK